MRSPRIKPEEFFIFIKSEDKDVLKCSVNEGKKIVSIFQKIYPAIPINSLTINIPFSRNLICNMDWQVFHEYKKSE